MTRMIEPFTTAIKRVFCHRVIYGGLALAYAAGCLGANDALVHLAAAGFYVMLCCADKAARSVGWPAFAVASRHPPLNIPRRTHTSVKLNYTPDPCRTLASNPDILPWLPFPSLILFG